MYTTDCSCTYKFNVQNLNRVPGGVRMRGLGAKHIYTPCVWLCVRVFVVQDTFFVDRSRKQSVSLRLPFDNG